MHCRLWKWLLDKKQIRAVFIFKFKNGSKQQKRLTKSTMHLAQKLLMNIQCTGSSRSFAKETRVLKVMRKVASHRKLTTTNWEQSLKLINFQLHKKLPKNSLTILQSFGIWSKLERWKSSRSECLKNWPPIKKIVTFKCCLFLFYATMNHFSTWLWGVMKSGFLYDNQWQIGQWLDREEARKHFPKPNLHQKKGHGHSLVVCWWSDPLQLSESQQNHYIWEVCPVNQWDEWKTATLTADPILFWDNAQLHVTQPTLQKLNKLGNEVLAHLPYSPDLSSTD